jgi:hypothetical protein
MPTAKINATKFEQMIARRGRSVSWKQAILCSCWNMNSGQPNYACQACGGKGYTYETPVTEIALVMSITQNKEFDDSAGVFEIGDAVMTVPRRVFKELVNAKNTSGVQPIVYERENQMFDIGMYDLVTLLDDEYRTSELLIRNETMYGRPADTLLNEDVTEIITIRKSDPLTGTVTKYVKDTDFTNTGNHIDWIGVSAPAAGETYSVTYKHRPVYTVTTNLPKPRYQDGQELPRYVALRYRAGGFDKQ